MPFGQGGAAAPAQDALLLRWRKVLLAAGPTQHPPIQAGGQGLFPLAGEGPLGRLLQAPAEGLHKQGPQLQRVDGPEGEGRQVLHRIGPVAVIDRIEDEHRVLAIEPAAGRLIQAANLLLHLPQQRVVAGQQPEDQHRQGKQVAAGARPGLRPAAPRGP